MARRKYEPPPAQAAPPSEPAKFTVLVINELLRGAQRYGFPTLEKAKDYVAAQVPRTRTFMVYRILHGAPKDHGDAVPGLEFRGEA